MSEKETWYAIETSRAGEEDWCAYTNTTYDSAGFAWRELRKLQKYFALDPQRWDVRVVRKDLVTTVEDNPIGVCAKCRVALANMRGVIRADDGALFHGRCWVSKETAIRTYKCFKCKARGCGKPYSLCAKCLHADLNS